MRTPACWLVGGAEETGVPYARTTAPSRGSSASESVAIEAVVVRSRALPNARSRVASAQPMRLLARSQTATTRPVGWTATPTVAMFAWRRSMS